MLSVGQLNEGVVLDHISAGKAMEAQTMNRSFENIIIRLPRKCMILLTMSIFFLPKTSAMTPEGSSNIILVMWNTVSAMPISTRLKPLAASSATHAPVRERFPITDDRYSPLSCFLILNIKKSPLTVNYIS